MPWARRCGRRGHHRRQFVHFGARRRDHRRREGGRHRHALRCGLRHRHDALGRLRQLRHLRQLRAVARPPPGAGANVFVRDALDLDRRHAAQQVEPGGRGVAQVDHAVVMERATIVHPHDRLAAIGRVAHAHVAGQRQRLVRRGHRIHVVRLAARGGLRMELGAVPGGQPALAERAVVGDRHVGTAEHGVGLAGAAPAAADGFDAGLGIGHARHVGGRVRRCAVSAAARSAGTAGEARRQQGRHHKPAEGRRAPRCRALSQTRPSRAPASRRVLSPAAAARPASALR